MCNNDGKKTSWQSLFSWFKHSYDKLKEWIQEKRNEFTPKNIAKNLGRYSLCLAGTAIYGVFPAVRNIVSTSLTNCFSGNTFFEKLYRTVGMFIEPPHVRIGCFTVYA